MAYTPNPGQRSYSPQLEYYAATPPPPPPKTSAPSTPSCGPPLPPPPPGQALNEAHELDGNAYLYQQQQHEVPAIPPVEQTWLPEILKDKSTADLHALLHDPSLQSAFLSSPNTTHPSLSAAIAALQPAITTNTSLATTLQTLERQLSHLRSQTQSRLLSLRALEQQHRTKLAETETALQAWSPMALYQSLLASVQEQEALVRGLEESWLDEGGVAGEREVGEFVRRVREGAKVAFLRRERKERWDEGRVGGWR